MALIESVDLKSVPFLAVLNIAKFDCKFAQKNTMIVGLDDNINKCLVS